VRLARRAQEVCIVENCY